MMSLNRKLSRLTTVVIGLIFLLIIIRVLAPPLILNRLNKDLAALSPVYEIKIEKLHLSFIRMFYRLENIKGTLKKNGKIFLTVESIDVSISWSELLKARILTDIEISHASLITSPSLFKQSTDEKSDPKEDAENFRNKLFPLRVSRIQLHNSEIEFGEFIGQPNVPTWKFTSLDGGISNLTPTETAPISFFNLRGAMLNSPMFKATGKFKYLDEPIAWLVQMEVHKFKLSEANPLFYSFFPMTFKQGDLDLFAEVKSEHGKIQGYAKPFFKDILFAGNEDDFKGLKHFAVEIVGSIGNAIFRRNKDKSIATKVDFYTENGKLKVDTREAIGKAIEHGFGNPISPGLEGSFDIK